MSSAPKQNFRILRVADVPDNRHGGMSRTMYCTSDCLTQWGHHVDYLFHESFQWRIPRQIQRYLRSWEAASIIKQRIRDGGNWDVVEIHEPLALAYGLARRLNPNLPPMVVFSYGIESRSYEAMSSYRELKRIPFSLKSKTTASALVLQATVGVSLSSHTICSNQQDVNFLRDVRQIPVSRLTRHHSGVEKEFIEAGNAFRHREPRTILFMGNWIERKGILEIIPAVITCLKKHLDARFTVAGCNCPEETILHSFPDGVRDRITVIPHIRNLDGLIQVYRAHSIMLLPSYFEGHPLVMVEAAAMGLAIITSPVCGMLDFIENDVSGLFSPVGSIEGLTAHLDSLLSDQQRTRTLGEGARKVASAHTWESAAVKIEAAYRMACEVAYSPRV
jgi:glycosyltransferase involved in cell wall biosynthesis